MASMSRDFSSSHKSGFSASIACQTLQQASRSVPSPTHSFHARLAKKRATWHASEDGTAFGSRSSRSIISFRISDILRGWLGVFRFDMSQSSSVAIIPLPRPTAIVASLGVLPVLLRIVSSMYPTSRRPLKSAASLFVGRLRHRVLAQSAEDLLVREDNVLGQRPPKSAGSLSVCPFQPSPRRSTYP